ncbi:MAG: hypothetical protein ACERKV_09435 [Clostridiaceae bacterium]
MKKISIKINRKYIIISIICVLIVFIYLLFNRITYGNNFKVFTITSSSDTMSKIAKASKDGESLDINSAELNGIFQIYPGESYKVSKNIEIEKVLCSIDNKYIQFYIPSKMYGINTIITIKGKITYLNDNFTFTPEYIKLGKVKIPKNIIFDKFKEIDNENIKIDGGNIIISSDILPIAVDDFKLDEKYISLTFPKHDEEKEVDNSNSDEDIETSDNKQEVEISQEQIRKNQLQSVYNQLGTVYNSVKTDKEKAIISTIRSVVNKMIADPNYKYQTQAAGVKSEYAKLSEDERSDVKNSILMNMSMSSLRMLNETFNLI